MKYGFCINCPKVYAVNSRRLCRECTKARHEHSASMKGILTKTAILSQNHEETRNNGLDNKRRGTPFLGSVQGSDEFDRGEQREVCKAKQADKKTYKIKHRSSKNKEIVRQELLLFKKIFEERPNKCEWCSKPITCFSPINFHHLKTKGSHPELRLVESNIVKICAECHINAHSTNPRKHDEEN